MESTKEAITDIELVNNVTTIFPTSNKIFIKN